MTEFFRVRSLEKALEFLHYHSDKTKIIAGGTDCSVNLKKLKSFNYILDISGLEELSFIKREEDGRVRIGSLTTFAEIVKSQVVKEYFMMLACASSQIGSPQIRNRATLGGNIVNASPAGDSIPPLFVFDAIIICRSYKNEQIIPICQFFTGPGKTILKPDEIVTVIELPPLGFDHGISFFKKIGQRKAQAISKVSVAFNAKLDNGNLYNVKIALGAVAKTVIYAEKAASFLEGKRLNREVILKASEIAKNESSPIDDIRSNQNYRRILVQNLLIQGLIPYLT